MLTAIEVSEDNILAGKETGQMNACTSCPIALAVKPLIRKEFVALVTKTSVNFYGTINNTFVYLTSELPIEAKRFILRFDNKKGVKPFSFPLVIPDEVLNEQEN